MACYLPEKGKFYIVSVSSETRNRCLLKASVDAKIVGFLMFMRVKTMLTLCFTLPVSTEIRISTKKLPTCSTTR